MLVLKKVAWQVQVSSPRISKPAMTAGRSTCGPTEMLPRRFAGYSPLSR